ncbi:hypothetical protein ZOD2009_21602 [Haladaptatus paucihalophilus DX253]|uniref:Uncharacterized protein n=1 Tax=Haladaptatus paucihalophilus DX253 TaxID=797209 RepID=E7QZS7_HALPU|nr:hypothetical protein ZOD2009_21602 [Haladaptatus paucihalophilus DX253]
MVSGSEAFGFEPTLGGRYGKATDYDAVTTI